MNSIQETLVKSGFEPSVAKIYVILAESGRLTANTIIAKSGLSRAGTYDALNILLADGFVTLSKEGRNAIYTVSDPNKLQILAENRQRETESLRNELGDSIRSLIGSYNLAQNKPGVRFFEGNEGIREMLFDSLNATGEILTIANFDSFDKEVEEINREYVRQRVLKGIHKRIIAPASPMVLASYDNLSAEKSLVEIRFVDQKKFSVTVGIQIYNNCVSFMSLKGNNKIGVLIQDTEITNTLRIMFDFMWDVIPN